LTRHLVSYLLVLLRGIELGGIEPGDFRKVLIYNKDLLRCPGSWRRFR
jgi:hypothetical protein